MTRKLYALSGTDTSRPFSPHVWKTKLSLAHKGLTFDIAPVGFTEIPRLEQGATKIVPLLRDGEKLVSDSFDIALYLEEAYPDRPPLLSGEGGKAMARFVEGWSQTTLHPAIGRIAIMDIHDSLDPIDRAYFRASREERFGRPLEAVAEAGRGDLETFSAKLEPIRHMLSRSSAATGRSLPIISSSARCNGHASFRHIACLPQATSSPTGSSVALTFTMAWAAA